MWVRFPPSLQFLLKIELVLKLIFNAFNNLSKENLVSGRNVFIGLTQRRDSTNFQSG